MSEKENGVQSMPKKGSAENPYTQKEYEEMCDAGTWNGGYVSGMGYVLPEVVVTGSSNSEEDWSFPSFPSIDDSWIDSWKDDNPEESNNSGSGGCSGSSAGNSSGGNSNWSSISGSSGNNQRTNPATVADIVSPSNFSGYKATDKKGCFRRCKEMLSTAGCEVSGAEIAMVNSDGTGRATTATSDFSFGINYINEQLLQGHPVIVSVDYKCGTSMGSSRQDQAGDHFVIIVGGNLSSGYHYYDPATQWQSKGTSSSNKFTLQNGLLKNANTCMGKAYTVSGIRKNK